MMTSWLSTPVRRLQCSLNRYDLCLRIIGSFLQSLNIEARREIWGCRELIYQHHYLCHIGRHCAQRIADLRVLALFSLD